MIRLLSRLFPTRPIAPTRLPALGIQTLEPREVPAVLVELLDNNTRLVVTGTADNDTVTVSALSNTLYKVESQSGTTYHATPGLIRIEFTGGDGADRFENTTAVPCWADGGVGDDILIGGTGDDTLSGGDGNDELRGRAGDDEVRGGAGDDDLFGGAGDDFLFGSIGNDTLSDGDGADVADGGAGDDTLVSGGGPDLLIGNYGRDTFTGNTAEDTVFQELPFDFEITNSTRLTKWDVMR